MAGSCICRNFAYFGKDELTGKDPIEGSSISTFTLANSKTPISALIPAPGASGIYINVDLHRATRLSLESFI